MWRWLKSNLQSLGSVAAITVSVVALYVAWDQSRVMRAQQHADVWPALQIGTQYVTMDEYLTIELAVENNGIGPALVDSVTAYGDGQPRGHWEDLAGFRPEGLPRPGMWTGALFGEILAPGEEYTLAQLTWPNLPEVRTGVDDFRQAVSTLEVEVCYCSVYGRCWTATLDRRSSRPVDTPSCPVQAEGRNL